MDNFYILMVVALALLASIDLIVGVSNDAVNFLNSAIGSKVFKLRTILIVASIGIGIGAVFSSGMMEVARKSIFHPEAFYFNEIMIIFMAVMITDVLLLDLFNNLGLPTSTTVSIVFELLGAALAVGFIKMYTNSDNPQNIDAYMNWSEALRIIGFILLSVVIAFSVGLLVQWITRYFLTFDFMQKPSWVGVLFGTIALTAITYFIILKGLKGTELSNMKFEFTGTETFNKYIQTHTSLIVGVFFMVWGIVSSLLVMVFKLNIYKVIILVGTFALSLAFAGNDLVNFVGVPIAGLQSYQFWHASGVPANEYLMTQLAEPVSSNPIILFACGLIMILTLWYSKKALAVTETEINLAREGESHERFQPNIISRNIVRFSSLVSESISDTLPESWKRNIEERFTKPVIHLTKDKTYELPAFDQIRASVNLMTAAIIISVATSMKLPLSTTYVTFMVAMGTSLADRAWNSESAVYRVAGVLNVIGGWFATALIAMVSASLIAFLIHLGGKAAVAVLIILTLFLLIRSAIAFKKRGNKTILEDEITHSESNSLKGVIDESASNIAKFAKRSNKIYTNDIVGLSTQDLNLLKRNKKQVEKLNNEIEKLSENIFYFIKNLEEPGLQSSNFYIHIIAYLQDMAQSLQQISKVSYKHINNNHKKLNSKQVADLEDVKVVVNQVFENIQEAYKNQDFTELQSILENRLQVISQVQGKIDAQIERTRKEESSPKNTTLYFSILLETKDLLTATYHLLDEYYRNYTKVEESE